MVDLDSSFINNNGLFAQHYLENRLPNMDQWQETEGIEEAYKEIKELWEQEKDIVENYNEAQLEENFIKKVFEILNHSYGVQATVRENAVKPDYGFFKTKKDKKEAHKQKEVDDFYKESIAIGDAKQWGISLDKKTKSGRVKYERSNPSWQIYMYLKETPANWGVLTNGKKWRLYNEQTSDRLDTYYEIDLPTILKKEDQEEALQEFKYFYLFFRQKAFTPTKKSFLDKTFKQSEKYSQRIGENLEESVYEALRWMAKGYYQNKSNWNDPEEGYPDFLSSDKIEFSELDKKQKDKVRDIVDEIHHYSLVFLYRLLFLFYAESKDKLGRDVPKNYDFDRWVDNVLNDFDEGEIFEKGGTLNYRLRDIFKLLKEGSEGMGLDDQFFVPAYNGNLFETKEFLTQNNIHDGYVAKVVDLLARDPLEDETGKGRVDYSDLSIRHIGGIYEGLLEYQLKIAEQDMVAEKDEWKPITEANKDFSEYDEVNRAREGELYLATDKGERKATGSYYTPDYIVEYIVQNTVKPKAEEKLQGLKTDKEKREAILDINVLDPAMGSGHFLVDTLDYLSNKLVKYAPENIKGKEIDWAKRKVVRNCLYGVDVNPLATELAKVSLWLETMTEDKPLPFLDHHLRTGNSLIGANLDDLQAHPDTDRGKKDQEKESKPEEKPETDKDSQVNLLDFVGKNEEDNGESIEEKIDEILETQQEIMETTESRPDDIKEEKKIYQRFRNNDLLLRLKMLADIHTSHYFGNNFTKEQYEELKNSLTQKEWKEITEQEWIKKYTNNLPKKYNKDDNLAKQKLFFHWKLEFPGVFFDIEEGTEQKDAGFDAVVGNPPYNAEYSDELKDYIKTKFEKVDGNYNSANQFIELAKRLTRENHGMIIPKSVCYSNKWKGVRNYLIDDLDHLLDAGKAFDGVLLEAVIYIASDNQNEDVITADIKPEGVENHSGRSKDFFKKLDVWVSAKPEEEKIAKKLLKKHSFFSDYANIERGELIQSRLEDQGVPVYRGNSISRYNLAEAEDYLPESDYEELKDDLEYLETSKLMVQNIVAHVKNPTDRVIMMSVVDEEGVINLDNVGNIFPTSEKFDEHTLCAIFNSSLISWYLYPFVYGNAIRTMRYDGVHLKRTPLPDQSPDQNLGELSEKIHNLKDRRNTYNINIKDYLTASLDDPGGKTLGEMYMPVEGLSDSILTDTKEDRDNIKIGSVEFEEQNSSLILNVSVKYKPEDDEGFDDEELDRWGYVETDLMPAMNFTVGDKMKALIKEFVPVAVDEAGGFANFREKATKTNSVVDRLEDLTLPKLDDVQQGLEKFIENKEEAEALEEEIQETDEQIDAIVFDLYDLTESEVETVLDSLDTDNKVKKDILSKFRDIKV